MTTRSEAPSGGPGGTIRHAREQAAEIGHETAQAGGNLARQVADEGRQLSDEAGRQARNLVGQASAQLRQQAGAQQKRAADGLRALGTQLQSMAGKSEQDGMAAEVVLRASDAAQQAARWLDEREPGAMLDEVRDYARQHPATFLAGAVVAGLLVGRLTRNVAASDGGAGPDRGPQPGPGGQPATTPSFVETAQSRPATGGVTATPRSPGSGVIP